MGVMACDRAHCEHILCTRLILDGRSYICPECWAELLEYKETWPEDLNEDQVRKRIDTFMETSPGCIPDMPGDTNAAFKKLTKNAY